MTVLDLFSGIGGFSLAFEREGFQTIGFSEIDPYASAVLKKHWPNVPNYGDIRNIPTMPVDIITGGFPCQPFSLAGKRRGKEDDRHLWPEMLNVIARCKPDWVLGENVPGIISMELDRVLSDLENIGYATWPLVIPACAVDARHRRDRVWIVAHSNSFLCGERRDGREHKVGARALHGLAGSNCGAKPLAYAKRSQWRSNYEAKGHSSQRENRQRQAASGAGKCGEVMADSRFKLLERWQRESTQRTAQWEPEPNVGRVAYGIPNRVDRLRCLGNSIVPQVAQVIAKAIRQIMESYDH